MRRLSDRIGRLRRPQILPRILYRGGAVRHAGVKRRCRNADDRR